MGGEPGCAIVIDPAIQHGKPVIRGTRVPVARILGGLAGGMTPADVCQEYDITADDLRAVLAYAARLVEADQCHGRGRPPHPRRALPQMPNPWCALTHKAVPGVPDTLSGRASARARHIFFAHPSAGRPL